MNLADIIIIAILGCAVFGALRVIIRNKKAGMTGCGGDCAHCMQICGEKKQKPAVKPAVRDMTTGLLGKQILFFSVPLMLSNLLQVLFNMADVAVIGRFAGAMSLGSVGSTTILVSMFTGFLIGVSGGINVMAARYIGGGNSRALSETVHTSAIVSTLIGILLTAVGVLFARPILELLNTKPELIEGAVLYLTVYFLGMPALAVYNFGNAIFSAAGDTARPLRYLAIAGVINVILNLFFVIECRMDVAGVALASIISQYLSAGMIVAALIRSKENFRLRFSELRLSKTKARSVLQIGIPAGVQNAIFQIANLFIQTGVNSFSAIMVAGNSAAANADALVYDVMAAFYTACGSFMGQNYGAGKRERVLKSYFISLGYSFGIGAAMGISLVLFGRQFLSLFTNDPEVISAGMQRLTIMGFSYGFSAFMDGTIAASRAMGKSLVPTVVVIMGSCVFRIIWVNTVFAYFRTIPSLYLLYIFSWTITAAAEIIYFAKIYRVQIKKCRPGFPISAVAI